MRYTDTYTYKQYKSDTVTKNKNVEVGLTYEGHDSVFFEVTEQDIIRTPDPLFQGGYLNGLGEKREMSFYFPVERLKNVMKLVDG